MSALGLVRRAPLGAALVVLALSASLVRADVSGQPSPAPGVGGAESIIKALLKPSVYTRVTDTRDVMTWASLDDVKGDEARGMEGLRRYAFYASMSVRASPAVTRRILTDYKLYAQLVKYMDKAEYDESTKLLLIEGGIWKYRLLSRLHFEERGPGSIHYRIVSGHFAGLEGDIFMEPQGEKSTLVMMRGEMKGRNFPPALVVEQGAQIVFGFTGERMRDYIESRKSEPQKKTDTPENGSKNGQELPRPRAHL